MNYKIYIKIDNKWKFYCETPFKDLAHEIVKMIHDRKYEVYSTKIVAIETSIKCEDVWQNYGTRHARYLGIWFRGACHFPTYGLRFIPV